MLNRLCDLKLARNYFSFQFHAAFTACAPSADQTTGVWLASLRSLRANTQKISDRIYRMDRI